MSNVRAIMLVTGEVVIANVNTEMDTHLILEHPVTIQPVMDQTGQQRLTFVPFFPMAEYDPKHFSLPTSTIALNLPAQAGLVNAHIQHVASRSGLVMATTMPPEPQNRVSGDEMRNAPLRLINP